MNVFTAALLLTALNVPILGSKSKNKLNADEFLKNEKKKLESKKVTCQLRKITRKNINNLRLQAKNDVLGISACTIAFLEDNRQDGFFWSYLGSLYLESESPNEANTCFKIASKITGKISASITEWHFIGPFVIGKMEVDGDPLEAYGGIYNVSKQRLVKSSKFYSELFPDGGVVWTTIKVSPKGMTNVAPKLNWNDLVSSLGSLGITEWQGWLVGEFTVNEKDQNIIFQCLGVHTIYIDGIPINGEVYHREKFWFSLRLAQGLHQVYIKLRTKVSANLKCSLSLATSVFSILETPFLPDLVDGKLFSQFVSIPVVNFHNSKWIRVNRVSVSMGRNFKSELVSKNDVVTVAPGQTFLLRVKIFQELKQPSSNCDPVDIELKISTSEGPFLTDLTLRCRRRHESFLFTFLDHDGSIQHAAGIQPIDKCLSGACPVLLTLHGTTVPPQNQADSYKHMVDGKFVFGMENTWVLAPTRHGAHNWEGPGALTAMAALNTLAEITSQELWQDVKADPEKLIFTGHSMGGHGAWHLATHFPDKALALISLAGWIKKEEYGDSNLFFRHDVATSHVDPSVKAVLEACIVENEVDKHVVNLKKVPVLARIGADDRTVHPFYVRRMYRLLKEVEVGVNYTELAGKEHWWWDTRETNDGGVVNDKQLRDFTLHHSHKSQKSCDMIDGSCDTLVTDSYSEESNTPQVLTVTCYNPAFMGSVFGLKILQQITPFRKSEIKIQISNGISLLTTNVARFTIKPNRRVDWHKKSLKIDGYYDLRDEDLEGMLNGENAHLCKHEGEWRVCTENLYANGERGPNNLGPARRIAESEFLIVIGTNGEISTTYYIQRLAVYLANLFLLTSDAVAPIVMDKDLESQEYENKNLIIIGGSQNNMLTEKFLKMIPVDMDDDQIVLRNCRFANEKTGLFALVPHGPENLALLLSAHSIEGLYDVISLATPTIPPMTRSPFSNLLPDYVITGPEFRLKGPGGYLCAGFWGNKWEYRPELSSCVC